MIARDLKRLALLLGPLVVLLLLTANLWRTHTDLVRSHVGSLLGTNANPKPSQSKPGAAINDTHNELLSVSTPDGRYFEIKFGNDAYNPNIVAHPKFNDTWFMAAQVWKDLGAPNQDSKFEEVGCMARFIKGVLMCIGFATPLPIAPTPGGKCEGEISWFSLNVGPHDARVFYGPQNPFTIYGSNSGITCFGQWIQDFRKLVDWEYELMTNTDFEVGTELRRPAPVSAVEKNWFLFWDKDDEMHLHFDIFPKRGFAKLERDGSAGPNLAPTAAAQDEKCLQRYLPKMPPKLESIHQATNSLKITLCDRGEANCKPNDDNTFILTIIQHKTYYDWHGEYEPYVVLFRQRAPFELYAISRKPLWIHGRQRYAGRRTDMMYVTSVNWKDRGVNYHGFLDDVLFLGFGIEDKYSAGIDVRGRDLLVDMGLCDEA